MDMYKLAQNIKDVAGYIEGLEKRGDEYWATILLMSEFISKMPDHAVPIKEASVDSPAQQIREYFHKKAPLEKYDNNKSKEK